MCGIFGITHLHKSFNPQDRHLQERLQWTQSRLSHRGPNDSGHWVHPDGRLAFAHTRLSILDLSQQGHQPMSSRSRQSWITYNGEIYNFKDLHKQFSLGDLKSQSDTEVLVESLEKIKTPLLQHLDGMFAFGFYSERRSQLLLAVDRAGEKPLYTYWDGETFAFASEIKAFDYVWNLNLQLDPESIQDFLVLGYIPYPKTIYKHIRKLPAGHFQIFDWKKGPHSPIQYWDLPLQIPQTRLSYIDAQEQLRCLLKSSVRKRLVADVPVGSFLSGGLDSSAVSYEAALLLAPEKLRTFSVGFQHVPNNRLYDESPYARQVSQLIVSAHNEIQVTDQNLHAQAVVQHFDEPFADSSSLATDILCRETSRFVKVVLSGDGGDELFGGYKRFSAALATENHRLLFSFLLKPFLFKNAHRRSFPGYLARLKSATHLPLIQRLIVWNGFFSPQDLKKIGERHTAHLEKWAQRFEEKTHGADTGQKILYFNFKSYLFDDLLPKVDRISMRHGLEVRAPFLDKELIEFAFQLPTHYKFTAFQTKRILKDAYSAKLGTSITHRRKQGFAFPFETILGTEMPSFDHVQEFLPNLKIQNLQMSNPHDMNKIYLLWTLQKFLEQTFHRPPSPLNFTSREALSSTVTAAFAANPNF